MKISDWLDSSTRQLREADIPTARLDAEIILAHTLRKPRTWLHAYGDNEIDGREVEIADARIDLRITRVPLAYIIGHKEFYGRSFFVNTATLIPRPESEALIGIFLGLTLEDGARVVDVGTGSGALGITAALERPQTKTTLIDVDNRALEVARKNAKQLGTDVEYMRSDLLEAYMFKPDVVLANLPYVDETWETSPELMHEPDLALYASDNGMALIKKLFDQLHSRWPDEEMHILIEADPKQHHALAHYAEKLGYRLEQASGFIAHFVADRVEGVRT